MLRLRLLGTVQIEEGKRPLTHQLPQKAQALLAYLAVTKQPYSRAKLAGLLWSDFPENRARSNLRDTLLVLRRQLDDYLDISRQSVALIDGKNVWVDTAVFQKHLNQARTFPEQPELKIEALEAATSLYNGEFLAGFYLPKTAVFDEWVTAQREHFHQLAVNALQTIVDYNLNFQQL